MLARSRNRFHNIRPFDRFEIAQLFLQGNMALGGHRELIHGSDCSFNRRPGGLAGWGIMVCTD